MIIYSDFRDYYDGVSAYGQDTSLRFKRRFETPVESVRVSESRDPLVFPYDSGVFFPGYVRNLGSGGSFHRFGMVPIVVCSRYYPRWFFCVNDQERSFFDSAEEANEMYNRKLPASKANIDRGFYPVWRITGYWKEREQVLARKIKEIDWVSVHRHLGSPIIRIDQASDSCHLDAIANPKLSDYQFQKVIHPFEIYSEISSYLVGPMATESKPPVEISNKEKIVKHGFSLKESFRKRPTLKAHA